MMQVQTHAAFIPQANSLSKVAAVADAVAAGATTSADIADALDVVTSQGAYYAKAARLLGLVEPDPATSETWQLTGAGRTYTSADDEPKAQLLIDAVEQVPAMAVMRSQGRSGVETLFKQDLADSTAQRRADTISSWYDLVKNRSHAVSAIAREAARAAGRARGIAARTPSVTVEVCDGCFIERSVTGRCGCP